MGSNKYLDDLITKIHKQAIHRIQGQITVYAALCIVLILSLVTACFRSAMISCVRANIDAACSLSKDAVLAGYSNAMLSEYGIFLCKDSNQLDLQLNNCLKENLNHNSGTQQSSLVSGSFNQKTYMTDDQGVHLKEEVVSYMKYAALPELLLPADEANKQVEQAKAIKETTEQVADCQDKVADMSAQELKLVELIEGIKTDSTGIVIQNSNPVATGDYYAKALLKTNPSNQSTAIDNQKVYQAMTGLDTKYLNASETILNMKDELAEMKDILEAEHIDQEDLQEFKNVYKQNYESIKNTVDAALAKNDQAEIIINGYQSNIELLKGQIETCIADVQQKTDKIGQEVASSFISDLTDLKNGCDGNTMQLCEKTTLQEGISDNKTTLTQIKEKLEVLDPELIDEHISEMKDSMDDLEQLTDGIDYTKLKFDYSEIDFSSSKAGIGTFQNIYDTLRNGMAGLVLDGKTISDKSIDSQQLSSHLSESADGTTDESENTGLIQTAEERTLYQEYLFSKFASVTDYVDDEGNVKTDTGKKLDYMIEYILCGEDSDKNNLNQTLLELSVIREAMNLSFLITNAEKRNEALTLASTLVGFTGNPVLVKIAQYLIMTAWAYGESILDLRDLVHNDNVPLFKNASNWKLSLENLKSMDFGQGNNREDKKQGLNYEQYLRMLLLLQKNVTQYYRTMGAMELRMMELGKDDFSMKDYIVSLSGSATFKINTLNQLYTRQIQGGYI